MGSGFARVAVEAIDQLATAAATQPAIPGADKQALIDELDDAVDRVVKALGVAPSAPPAEPHLPLSHRSQVRWAYDTLRRGELKEATAMLRKLIKLWIEEEKA